jgi:glycosyltransferase involved in cell wall biosynthesis
VLAHARCAAAAGHEVTIAVSTGAPSELDTFHIDGQRVASLAQASGTEYDTAIASWWQDIVLLPRLVARRHVHLLQSMEDRFYRPNDVRRSLVRDVLRVPLPGITIADWLRNWFRLEYGRDRPVVLNGLDKSIFSREGPQFAQPRSGRVRVLVEGPLGVWHKNVVPALRLARSIADETWLLTSTKVGPIAGVDRVFSRVSPTDAAAVYRSCDILLKLSLIEGLPLPPLEMFHCGGTLVAFDIPGVTEYAKHGRNALLAPVGDFEIAAECLSALLRDRDLLEAVKSEALETARHWPSEAEAGLLFLNAIDSLAKNHPDTDSAVLSQLESLSHSIERTSRSPLNGLRSRVGQNRLVRSIRHSIEVRRPGTIDS